MRYLGLDLGSRTLGIAVSDSTGLIASNYKTIRHNEEYDKLPYYYKNNYYLELKNEINKTARSDGGP